MEGLKMTKSNNTPHGFKKINEDKLAVLCDKCNDPIKKVSMESIKETRTNNPRMYFPKYCKECKNEDPYTKKTCFDGAKKISYPPEKHMGSRNKHRRRTYTAYDKCKECEGKGRIWVSRSHAKGGSYYKQCEKCQKRYSSHPLRKAKRETEKDLLEKITEKYNSILHTKLSNKGYDPSNKKQIDNNYEEIKEEIGGPLYEKMQEKKEEARKRIQEHFEEATKLFEEHKDRAIIHAKRPKNHFDIIDKPSFEYEQNIPENTEQTKLI